MDWSEGVDERTAFAQSCIVNKTPFKAYSSPTDVTVAPRKERNCTTINNKEKQTSKTPPQETNPILIMSAIAPV
jgi:hypothetical protein